MKLLTLEDYQKAGEQFWPKYWYVAKELGEDSKPEDVLKVMEAVGGVALKLKLEETVPFGFNKNKDGALEVESPDQCPSGTVAMKSDEESWACYNL